MKQKILAAALLLLKLVGCSTGGQAQQADAEPSGSQQSVQEEVGMEESAASYYMLCALPSDAVAETFSEDTGTKVYTNPEGDYELRLETLPGLDGAAAVRSLSGFEPEELDILQTERFDMPEYHFTWYAVSDEGDRLYRAAVLEDADCCYALVFSTAAEQYPNWRETAEYTVSTLGLFGVGT